jgi:ABC-type multidrug transport system ATPase subunit
LQVNGEVLYFDSEKQTKEHLRIQRVAWLKQKDHFFSQLTVEETLLFAAYLELPELSEAERETRVQSIMESLGLAKLMKRKIGDSGVNNGLSGGEKRRLSLALELLASPLFFIGDEPTSGLDSSMSEKVVRLIKRSVEERNIPCILSLHQPRSSIWKMLDSVILMAPGGHVLYMGEADQAVAYFSKLGYKCPVETNPAEFLLDLVSIDSEDAREASEDELRISFLAAAFAEKQHTFEKWVIPVQSEQVDLESVLAKAVSRDVDVATLLTASLQKEKLQLAPLRPLKRFVRLLLRSWRQNIRNNRVNFYRLIASGGTAYLFTNIFQSIKKGYFTSKSVADRVALLSFSVINMSMMALMKTIELFAKEKPVVQREQQRKQYSSLEYLLAKSIAEIPLDAVFAAIFTTTLKSLCGLRIGWQALTGTFTLMTVAGASLGFAIGALSPTGDVAMTISIPILVVLMTVGIINPSGVDQSEPSPPVVEALKQISPVAFAIRALCLAEYRGMEFQPDPSLDGKRGFFWRGRVLLRDLPKMGALALVQNGDQVLDELGLSKDDYQGAMKHLAMISCFNLVLSWIGLRFQALSNQFSGPRKSA